MEEPGYCVKCGTQLADGACPACLLKLGLSGAIPPLADPAPASAPASLIRVRRSRVGKWLWPAISVTLLAIASVLFLIRPRTSVQGPVVRFSIPVPGADGPIALSPDGRKLAYTRRGPKGETLLWIHSFDSAEDRALDGADDAAFPFWSPDSRNIGFFAHGKLKRIESSGGPPLDLCDAPQGRGGTWNINGEILFAPAAFGPLSRVSAAGGVPQQLGPSDASRSSRTQRWPHALPDGRHFLYWATMPPPQGDGVFVGMTGSSEARALLPGASAAVFSNGYLLFVRRNVLLTQPFDALRLELTGEARPITEGAGWSADRGPAFSVSTNGLLAYRTSADPRARLVWVDRQGKIVGQVGEPGVVDAFSLSPDGMRAVIARRESEDGPSALWVLDFARGVNMRLTFGPLSNSSPIWSPDGSRILFSMPSRCRQRRYQVPANGSGKEELLLQTPGTVTLDSRSADGRFVAYTASGHQGGFGDLGLAVTGRRAKTDADIAKQLPGTTGDVLARRKVDRLRFQRIWTRRSVRKQLSRRPGKVADLLQRWNSTLLASRWPGAILPVSRRDADGFGGDLLRFQASGQMPPARSFKPMKAPHMPPARMDDGS